MQDINRVALTGRLTRDPELRATAGGTSVLGFGLAVNSRRKNQQTGQWEDHADFIDCTMFGNRAEALSRILAKGSFAAVEGRLRYSSWERDGQRRSKVEVVAEEVVLAPRAGDGASQAQPAVAYTGDQYADVYGEEIAF